ncbi:hypothetical protein BDR07DRAFT_1310271, partial [Suillus spraguei]
LWPQTDPPWPNISIGTILGCGSISLQEPNAPNDNARNQSNNKQGTSRLLRILISESAYLIWVLRCERVIQGVSHNNGNITKRWYKTIDNRL